MFKIIKINGNIVSIDTNEGGIKDVRTADINLIPSVEDEVEIFEAGNDLIVIKKKKRKK